MKTVIFANGPMSAATSQEQIKNLVRQAELIIAVDGGARHCAQIGIQPHVLLGDLDSVQPALVQDYEKSGVIIEQHPEDKDKTDLELALDLAVRKQATTVDILGGLGNRWDMSIANIMLMAAPGYSDITLRLLDGDTTVHLLRDNAKLALSALPGSRVSLIPLSNTVHGITLRGFRYPLHDQTIGRSSTLGISNVLENGTGRISLKRGLLLCILEGKDTA